MLWLPLEMLKQVSQLITTLRASGEDTRELGFQFLPFGAGHGNFSCIFHETGKSEVRIGNTYEHRQYHREAIIVAEVLQVAENY